MANSWGYDGSQLHPPHMSAWAKVQLGWSVPRLPVIGANTLMRTEEEVTDEYQHHVYRIGSEFGFPSNEYLLIEYRKPFWLNGGIAIYHIDESVGYNDEGYPGQLDDEDVMWPTNGKHYRVALIPADGLYDLEQDVNQGNSKDLYSNGAMLLPSVGNPVEGPFPNSDSYQGGNLFQTGVGIFANSVSGGRSISFEFAINASPTTFALPTTAPTSKPFMPPSFLPSSDGQSEKPSVRSSSGPSVTPSAIPSPSPSKMESTGTSTWRKLLQENFDSGTGEFIFGEKAKLDNKKCLATMCAEIKKSYIQVDVEVTALEALAIVFDFFTDGFKDKEEVIVQYAFLDDDNKESITDWVTVASWVKADNTFPNKEWIQQQQKGWYLGRTDKKWAAVRFATTSKNKFLIDNVSIWGT
jgi:hypothetical protein